MMKLDQMSQKQGDLTVFAIDPRGAHTPFTPPHTPVKIKEISSVL